MPSQATSTKFGHSNSICVKELFGKSISASTAQDAMTHCVSLVSRNLATSPSLSIFRNARMID